MSVCPTRAFIFGPPCRAATTRGFARDLLAQYNVTVLPGSYLARHAQGGNPGAGRIRMALVAETEECVEAARRIVAFVKGCTIAEMSNSEKRTNDASIGNNHQRCLGESRQHQHRPAPHRNCARPSST